MVTDAINLLDRQGFTKQAWMLRHVVVYRSSDNWWNLYTGHQQAYAATNFPSPVSKYLCSAHSPIGIQPFISTCRCGACA